MIFLETYFNLKFLADCMDMKLAVSMVLLILLIVGCSDTSQHDRSTHVEITAEMIEVNSYSDQPIPTAEQRQMAKELLNDSYEAAVENGWFDYSNGLIDGFKPMFSSPNHYIHEEYMLDDEILNPNKPEFLMYYDTLSGKKLVGYMYFVRTPDEVGPQIGGSLTVWHYHVWDKPFCMFEGMYVVGKPDAEGVCAKGNPELKSPEMMHVWFVDHPDGPFASRMDLPLEVLESLSDEE